MNTCQGCGSPVSGTLNLCHSCDSNERNLGPSNQSSFYSTGKEQPTYLIESILVTIFCCLPFGIPAIVYAAMAKSQLEEGNVMQASEHAETAKGWCIAAFVIGFILVIISLGAGV